MLKAISDLFLFFRFHFPYGNPVLNPYSDGNLPRFTEEFKKRKNTSVTLDELGDVLKVSSRYFEFLML